jgi:hypothetical protein
MKALMRKCIAVRSLLCAGWLVAGHQRAASAAVGGAGGVYDRRSVAVKTSAATAM